MTARYRLVFPALLFVCGMAMMFRPMLTDGFARSVGDSGDGVILIATLEHWWHLAEGMALGSGWRDVGIFYPIPGTLAFTDSYFVFAIPYAALRALGIGPFASYTGTIALAATLGYWGFYALSRRWAGAAAPFAAVGAFIFAFGTMPLWMLVHGQTYTITFAPLVGLALLGAWRARKPALRILLGTVAGLIYGLVLLSAAQTAWFLTFVGGTAAIAWLFLARPDRTTLRSAALPLLGAAIGTLIGFVPTIALYMPDLHLHHRRAFSEAAYYSPHAADLIQMPPTNWLWFPLEHAVGLAGMPGRPIDEMALGYTPVMLATVVIGALFLGKTARVSRRTDSWDAVAQACVIAPLLCWALELKYFGVHPWHLVFAVAPGASVIRTPFRIQEAGLMFLCLALAHVATRISAASAMALRETGWPARSRLDMPVWTLLLLGGALSLSLVEQVSIGAPMRHTAEIAGWLPKVPPPPEGCRAFYVVPMPGSGLQWYEHQSDAMMLAQWINMPTLNGNSSWWPDGWHLNAPEAPEYAVQVLDWIKQHGLAGRVCGVDPRAGKWTPGIEALEKR